jgi:uncharacterized protein YraI
MRLAVYLVLGVALLGCPADDPASGDTNPFGDIDKPVADAGGASSDDAPGEPSAPASAEAPQLVPVGRQATVRDPRDPTLNLRSGPSLASDVLVAMPNGTTLTVEACLPGAEGRRWCRVRGEAGTGWASESGLVLAEAPTARAAFTSRATVQDPDGWSNLRHGPGTEFGVVTRLVSGTPVEVVGPCLAPESSTSKWCTVTATTVSEGSVRGHIAHSRLRFE